MASEKPTILLVDDEKLVLNALYRALESPEWNLSTAESGVQALKIIEEQPIALVISDQRMPGMTGLELLNEIRRRSPETVRIILTGFAEMEVIIKAINQGEVFRFFTKPWDRQELLQTIRMVLERRRQNGELLAAYSGRLSRASLTTVMALAEAVELKDHYTKGHCSRVRDYSLEMARVL